MDVKWLEDFLALARTRSFSAAARGRGVTQPAFSRRIRSLETWAGVALVDRSSQPVALTAAGRKLRETAEETIRLLMTTREDLRSGAGRARPTVMVAALHSLASHFFPHWLRGMQQEVGAFDSRLVATDHESCIAAMRSGECDFLLSYWHPDVPTLLDPLTFPNIVIGSDSLVEVGAAGRAPGAGPLLRYRTESFLGRLTLPFLAASGVDDEVMHVSENAMAEELKGMVLAGHGRAWLPRSLIYIEIASGRLTIIGRHLPLQIRLHRNADKRRGIVGAIWAASQALHAAAA